MPQFIIQRSLYEARERPSKVYSWKVFMLSQLIVELPWNSLMAVIMFFCWYYPVGLYNNAAYENQVAERGALMFLFLFMFLIFTGTFSTFIVAGFETAEAGGNIANLMFSLCLIFCGVLASPSNLPGFWIFMYRVSPFTYMVSGMLSTALANAPVECADNEFLNFEPFDNQTCGDYLKTYIGTYGGKLQDPDATDMCTFCPMADTNAFLKSVNSEYDDRWFNFGILWVFVIFNMVGALAVYWLVRMPKNGLGKGKKAAKKETKPTTETAAVNEKDAPAPLITGQVSK